MPVASDGLTLSDTPSAQKVMDAKVTDGLIMGDSATTGNTYNVTASDGLELGDSCVPEPPISVSSDERNIRSGGAWRPISQPSSQRTRKDQTVRTRKDI